MNEIKALTEIKPNTESAFEKIKPEKNNTIDELATFWKDKFTDETIEHTEYKSAKETIDNTEINLVKKYLNNIEEKSQFKETLDMDNIDTKDFEKISPEETRDRREKFDDVKEKLIKSWEIINNREWPRYEHDVYDENGNIIRHKGDRYDIHHIIPLGLNGKNEVSNITPLDVISHKELHFKDGAAYRELESFLKEVNNG